MQSHPSAEKLNSQTVFVRLFGCMPCYTDAPFNSLPVQTLIAGVDPSALHQPDRRRWMLWKPLWGESARHVMHSGRVKGLFCQSIVLKIRKSCHTQLNISVLWKPVMLIKKKKKKKMPLSAASPLHNILVYLRQIR